MTEDDTFKALCRPSHKEMMSLYLVWWERRMAGTDQRQPYLEEYFESYGWTLDEFSAKANKDRQHD